jgi:hypothetical protein
MTYKQARQAIFDVLRARGWTLKTDLKTPYATSPSGYFRLWFKPQAVYYTDGGRHVANDARTISYELDIRKVDPSKFIEWVYRNFNL